MVHFEDFTNFLQGGLNTHSTSTERAVPDLVSKDSDGFQEWEKEYTMLLQKKEDLEKYNVNLSEQLAKYALLLTEEKNEKKELLSRHTNRCKRNTMQKVETIYLEKAKVERKYYLLLGILMVLLLLIFWLVFVGKMRI